MRQACSLVFLAGVFVLSWRSGTAAAASPLTAKASLIDPEAAWATSYLINTVMVREYEAVLAAFKNAPKERGSLETFFASESGQALWVRSQFAAAALRMRRQTLPGLDTVESQLLVQADSMRSRKVKLVQASPLQRAASASAVGNDPDGEKGLEAVAEAFASSRLKGQWGGIQRYYGTMVPSCTIETAHLQRIAHYLHKFIEDSGNEQSSSPAVILSQVQTWPTENIRCLAVHLALSPTVSPAEHLVFLMALRQGYAPLSKDMAVSVLTAQRLIELLRFPEALALLLDLADQDPDFRLPYEVLQRIFSAKQKGRGAVALQGI
jgi:hypothetical protein